MEKPIDQVRLVNRDRGLALNHSDGLLDRSPKFPPRKPLTTTITSTVVRLAGSVMRMTSIGRNRLLGIGGRDYGDMQYRQLLREETSLPSTRYCPWNQFL